MTFTPINVLRAVQKVKDTDRLGLHMGISESKRQEIYAQFSSVPQQRKSLIQYWMEQDPKASWRGLIVSLDGMGEKEVADNLRHLAEPITGNASSRHSCGLYIARSQMKGVQQYMTYILPM